MIINKIYVIFYFNYLMMLVAGRTMDYKKDFLKQSSWIAISNKIVFFNVNEQTDNHFPSWSGVCPVWAIPVSFVYTGLLVRASPHLHRLNLTYYSKFFTLLAFCFLFVFMIDPIQICLSPVSLELLELFQGILCNNEWLKLVKLERLIIRGEIN